MTAVAKLDAMKRIAAFVAVREKMAGTDPEVITESNGVPLLMSDLRAALSPAELGGVVTFDVVREVVKARTRLGFASPEGQEEQAARAIELIRELCEEVVNLNTASWAAEVITVTEPGDKGVRIRWRGGFPQVGDKLYATPRAAEAVSEEVQDAVDSILSQLGGWAKAYPLDIFSEPTDEEREWLHTTKPGLMDRIAASMGRHMAKCIAEDLAALTAALTSPSVKGENGRE